jgi:hypothetical protein
VPHARAASAASPAVGVAWRGRWRASEQASRRGQVLPLNPHNYRSFSLLWWRRVDCASYRLFVSPSLEFLGWLSPSPWSGIKFEVFHQSNPPFASERPHISRPLVFSRPVSLRARSDGRAVASGTLIRL